MAAPLDAMEAGTPGHVYELPPELTLRHLSSGRYARMGVIGDGSCFYHSVCSILDIDAYRSKSTADQKTIASDFRCKFNTSLSRAQFNNLSKGTDTGKTFEATLDALCESRVWADEVMIKLASRVLNMNLVFIDLGEEKLYCGVHGDETLQRHKQAAQTPVQTRKQMQTQTQTTQTSEIRGGNNDTVPMQPTAVIVWVNRVHFEPLVRIDSVDATGAVRVTRVFEPSKSEADKNLVQALMSSYLAQCPNV
jgi:hypothetical protein